MAVTAAALPPWVLSVHALPAEHHDRSWVGFAELRALFLDKVFPRMCLARSVDEVPAAAIERGSR